MLSDTFGNKKKNLIVGFLIFTFIVLFLCPIINAQITTFFTPITTTTTANWVALPPYNTLWPLWSPALSPISPNTGLPTPLVTSITPDTVLPVQPGLTWHVALGYPWLLYNTPVGLAYYDPWIGIDLWPPDLLINMITGDPITLTLSSTYPTLPPTPSWWLFSNLPAANWEYQVAYPGFIGLPSSTLWPVPTLTTLLTASAIL